MSMVFEKVKEVLADSLACDEEEITMETDLITDLEADSLDVVEISMAIEDEFGVAVPDEDLEKLQKVKVIVEYIQNAKEK